VHGLHLGHQVVATYTAALVGTLIACDPIDPVDVTGAIVLRTDFDDAGDTLSYAYSLDGGTTFVPSSSRAAPVVSQPVLPTPTVPCFGVPILAAGAAEHAPVSVPGPGAWTALGRLVAGLGLGRALGADRRRAGSRGWPGAASIDRRTAGHTGDPCLTLRARAFVRPIRRSDVARRSVQEMRARRTRARCSRRTGRG
jgi:hypothetical protein